VKARARIGTLVQPRSQRRMFDEQLIAWLSAADTGGSFTADLVSLRKSLEPAAAGMAAEAATARDLAVMEEALERMADAARIDDIRGYVSADRDFHAGLLAACHNGLLGQMSAIVTTTADYCLRVNSHRGSLPRESVKWHAELLDCIRLKDRQGAIAAVTAIFEGESHRHEPSVRANR